MRSEILANKRNKGTLRETTGKTVSLPAMQTFSCILSNTINPFLSFTEIREISVSSLSQQEVERLNLLYCYWNISQLYLADNWVHYVKSSLFFPHSLPHKHSLNCQAGILAEAEAQGSYREVTNTQTLFCSYNTLKNILWLRLICSLYLGRENQNLTSLKAQCIAYCIIKGKNYSYYFQYFYASFLLSRLGETVYIYSNQERGGRDISSPNHFSLKPCITTFTITSIY